MVQIEIQSKAEKAGGTVYSVAAVGEQNKALSTGRFTFVQTSFCNTSVKTMLVGGIATPVENRRGGNIRKMFDHMTRFAADNEVAVALLHPFSFSFYNQFHYEKVADHIILRCPTAVLDFVPRRCSFVPYEEKALPDMLEIYRQFSTGRSLLLPRVDDSGWKGKQVYICYENGQPLAYVVFSAEKTFFINSFRDALLTVHEMAFGSPKGLTEILSFLRMFEGEYDEIEFRDCGLYPELMLLLRHYEKTSCRSVPDLAARVLNTELMLHANAYPEKEGEFTLRILDDLPTVSGTYHVCYGGGDCRVTRMEESAEADLTLPGTVFTRVIYGNDLLNENTIRYLDGVKISGKIEDFFRAFSKRPCGVFEHF